MVLPHSSDSRASVDVEYIPALQVGGDYICVRRVGEDKLCVVVADVAGHGIASSLVMSRASFETERLLQSSDDLAATAQALNRFMRSSAGGERYLTLFGAEFDFFTQTITYVNCGHPAQLLWSQKLQRFTLLRSEHMPVGMFDDETFGTPLKVTLDLHAGDRLLLFTDGVLELRLRDGRELGQEGLIRMFRDTVDQPSAVAKRQLIEELGPSSIGRPDDDVLLVFVEITECSSARGCEEGSR